MDSKKMCKDVGKYIQNYIEREQEFPGLYPCRFCGGVPRVEYNQHNKELDRFHDCGCLSFQSLVIMVGAMQVNNSNAVTDLWQIRNELNNPFMEESK